MFNSFVQSIFTSIFNKENIFQRIHFSPANPQIELPPPQPLPPYLTVISNAKKLVGRFNASTIATPRLIELCKRKLVGDVSTRWSSTYLMLHRLLSSRQAVSKVCEELGWDSLSNTEWHALKTVVQLFKPFASYTS